MMDGASFEAAAAQPEIRFPEEEAAAAAAAAAVADDDDGAPGKTPGVLAAEEVVRKGKFRDEGLWPRLFSCGSTQWWRIQRPTP